MEQNFEIEFKNMLTYEELQVILYHEFSQKKRDYIKQSNYYFDTKNQDLKNQHSALRIRTTDSYNELTLKTPHEGFLMETNLNLSDNNVSEILNNKQFILSSYLTSKDIFDSLDSITEKSIFYLFNSFKTERLEKQVGNHLIVLDQTFYQNGNVDYELEIESTDAILGKEFFDSFLEKHEIISRPAKPKIRRAEENK